MRVTRYDVGRLGKVQRTPTGGVRVPASIARTGVQTYTLADGSTRVEYRPEEEVEAGLDSFAGAAITIGHPPETVTPVNFARLSAGLVSDRPATIGTVDGSPDRWVLSDLLLAREDAIQLADAGELTELSAGYSCELDMTPGVTPGGEKYDAVQRKITVNHVALLKDGCARAGRHARLRLDGCEIIADHTAKRSEPMPLLKIDGIEYEVGSPSHLSALDAVIAKRDARIAEFETGAGALQAKLDTCQAQVKELQGQVARIDSLVEAREALMTRVRPVLGETYSFRGKSTSQIQRDTLIKLRPTLSLDGRADSWIEAYFDATLEAQPAQAAQPGKTDFSKQHEDAVPAAKKAPWESEAEIRRKVREDSYRQ